MLTPSENEIKNILRNKDRLLRVLQIKRQEIYKEMENKEDYMRSLLLSHPKYGEYVQTSEIRDVAEDMLRYKKLVKRYETELIRLLTEITDEEEQIQKIWYCFTKLPEPYYTYLHELYVERKPYKEVLMQSGISNTAFARRRKKAFETIQMYFDYQ